MTSNQLRVEIKSKKIKTMDPAHFQTLLAAASDRTKLYLLLAANTGMTQQDISDLQHDELDLKAGTITRKRSKTADCDNVPEVTYKLWPETIALIKQEQTANDLERVLCNDNDGPLVSVQIVGGKLKRTDNVKSAYFRLTKKLKLKKAHPFKLIRKTGASLLKDSEYADLDGAFLGHAPASVRDKHYSQIPQERFNKAMEWLRGQFLGIK